ncbi:MAG: CotH kinase family protein, partial [Chthoniobacterales bacterium]
PTESSPVYNGPITLTAAANQNTRYSWIRTNNQQVGPRYYEGWQAPQGGVARLNVLRARVFKAGVAPGRIVTQSYLVHPDGTARYPYPVVSIATDPANLFDAAKGIYVSPNFRYEGSAWERPGHLEFFETDGSRAFAGDIGMRIHGNTTVNRPRKALRIYARNPDGPSTFNHRIFPQKATAFFDTFLLRASGNDWGQSIFRDALVSEIAAPSGLDHMSARAAVVFIDGEYWGLHNLRDRIDEGYYFHHYGLGEVEFAQLEIPAGNGSWPVHDRGNDGAGLLQDFEDILRDASGNQFRSMSGYDTLAGRIDIANFIDYQIHQIWSGNTDWPGNNVRLWRAVTPDRSPGAHPRHDGRWRWIFFDTDFALGLDFFYVPGHEQGPNHNTVAYASQTGGANFIGNSDNGTLLLRKALENSRFRNEFINRFADLLNTTLSADRAAAKLEEFRALYAPGMAEHVARWNQPYNWNNELARIANYLALRPAAVRGHLAGRFGLTGTADVTVDVAQGGRGTVKINSIGLEDSTPGVPGQPYPWTGTYFRGVPVTLEAAPAPGYRFAHWLKPVTPTATTSAAADAVAGYEVYSTSTTITPTLSADTGFVAAFEPEPAVALSIAPPVWTVGFGNAPLTVRAVNSLGDTDANFTGPVTLTVTGPGGVVGTYTAAAVEGLATFVAIDLPAGSYGLSAASGDLSTDSAADLTVRAAATFLPAGSGVWHLASNWDADSIPNSATASALIPANTASNRDVTNNAPTTVASVTFELGSSAFRSRINGTAGQPLTLRSANGVSTVIVTGTGGGHANIEVPGGLVFSNETVLDVQSIGSTNAEYGALRLQGLVSGPGPMVKRGPGMAGITGAGKTFSGDITIEQGVLTFSEPAITANNVTNYTVQPGGQLRLSSAGNPRNYLFKGPLNLAGSGRSGVSNNENLGVLGALRLEAGGIGTVAVLTNNVHLSASADIHVPAANAIQLAGPLTAATNTNVLTKSGGGTLVLASNASAFTGGLAVNRGTLQLDDALLINTSRALVLTNETALTGPGRWGGSIEARAGSTLAFVTGASPGGAAPLRAGSFLANGLVTIAVTPAGGAVAGAYPLLAVDGVVSGVENLALSLAATNFPASSLSFSNGTLYAVLSTSASPSETWLAQYGLPADGTGDGADAADPDHDGVSNLVERALFMNPRMAEAGGWPVASGPDGEAFAVTYRVARNQNDLSVTAESSPSLGADAEWTTLVPEVADDTHPDYTVYRASVPRPGGSVFVRLKVTR